jgi:enamine deaminase RidA (YjgF/YER057c/UK114 family)
MGKRVAVFPAGRQELYEHNKYSAAVVSGGFLFVSGQVGSRDDGSPEPNPEAQLRLAFENLNAVLAAGGCNFGDVVDFTLYCVDPETHMATAFKVKDEFWGEPPYPSLTAVGVTWLYGFTFELKVTAKIPETAS